MHVGVSGSAEEALDVGPVSVMDIVEQPVESEPSVKHEPDTAPAPSVNKPLLV